MSRVVEIQKQIEELEKKTQELQKELEFEKNKYVVDYPFEIPDSYWRLELNGVITKDWWSNDDWERHCYKQGHVFKNREEARKERDKRDLLMRFNQFRDKCNGDWKPDWSTHLDNKYHIYKAHGHEQLLISEDLYCTSFVTFGYFHKYEDAERAIELFGNQIKRLFVEEENE
nr:MAG TPA: exoenyzme S [Caudoviricetes sp.]